MFSTHHMFHAESHGWTGYAFQWWGTCREIRFHPIRGENHHFLKCAAPEEMFCIEWDGCFCHILEGFCILQDIRLPSMNMEIPVPLHQYSRVQTHRCLHTSALRPEEGRGQGPHWDILHCHIHNISHRTVFRNQNQQGRPYPVGHIFFLFIFSFLVSVHPYFLIVFMANMLLYSEKNNKLIILKYIPEFQI